MVVLHLLWSLWAFSFSYVSQPPFVNLAPLLDLTVLPAGTFLSNRESTAAVIARVTQVRRVAPPTPHAFLAQAISASSVVPLRLPFLVCVGRTPV